MNATGREKLVRVAINEISFRFAAIATRVEFRRSPRVGKRGPRLCVNITTRDRDNGDPTLLAVYWAIPTEVVTIDLAIDWIYACVRETWTHELNECFHVHDDRRRDLHSETGGAKPPPPDLINPWCKWERNGA